MATARQQLGATEQGIASARSTLAVLLGMGPDRGLKLRRPQPLNPASLSLPSATHAEVDGNLITSSPDIQIRRTTVSALLDNILSTIAL